MVASSEGGRPSLPALRPLRRGLAFLPLVIALSAPCLGAAPSFAHPGFQVTLTVSTDHGSVPLLVQFSASVLSGTPTWFSWDFGDRSYDNNTPALASTVAHTYTEVGVFNASVTVSEASGQSSNWILIHVTPAPLVVHATATPDHGTAPTTVAFHGTVSGGTDTYVQYEWSFGDGRDGVGLNVTETYSVAGNYLVQFNATDSAGASASYSLWVNISSPTTVTTGSSSWLQSPWALVVVALAAFVLGTLLAFVLLGRRERRERTLTAPTTGVPPAPAVATTEAAEARTPAAPEVPSPPATATLEVDKPSTVPPEALPLPPEGAAAEPPSPRARPSRTPRPAPSAAAPGAEALRVSERVVLHLAMQGALGADEVAPPAFTQAGMAESLKIRQNALTNVLRRLEAAGVLLVDVRHVSGRPRRMKVYRLTGRGESLARDLRHRRAGATPKEDER